MACLLRNFLRPQWATLSNQLLCVPINQKRGMPANLASLKRRKKTVITVSKITATVKVVASSRLAAAHARASAVAPVCHDINRVFQPLVDMLKVKPETKTLVVIMCTDKGLCGSTNNSMLRILFKEDLSKNSIIVWGEKGCPSLEISSFTENVVFSAHPSVKTSVTFNEIGAVTDKIATMTEYDLIRIVYNEMLGNHTSKVTEAWIPSGTALSTSEAEQILIDYQTEELNRSEFMKNLHEFHLSACLNYAAYSNIAVETLNRRNSMDNASKNADEVGQKLTLLYNRVRQAAITTELCEITAGASALNKDD